MEPNVLELLVGLPRSGKSTYAREQIAKGAVIVNPDSIRLAIHGQLFVAEAEDYVWAVAKTMVRALFKAGHQHVIVDATNTTRRRRDFWLPSPSDPWDTRYFTIIDTSCDECAHRAGFNEPLHAAIIRMAQRFEPVLAEEGLINLR